MVIKVYIASSTGSIAVKKHQQAVVGFLEANRINFQEVDITMLEEQRLWMYRHIPRDKQPEKGNPLPPQIFNEDRYCGVRGGDVVMGRGLLPSIYTIFSNIVTVDQRVEDEDKLAIFFGKAKRGFCQFRLKHRSLVKSDYEDFFLSKENNTVFAFLGLSSHPSVKDSES